jgi:hypothetical protein
MVEDYCEKYIKLGPCIGHASDGDPKRRGLMGIVMKNLINNPKEGSAITELGQEYETPYRISQVSFLTTPKDIFDQDWIHNIKKLINPLNNSKRNLNLLGYPIHGNSFRLLRRFADIKEHRLTIAAIERKDKQNYKSAKLLFTSKVIDVLEKQISIFPFLKGMYHYLKFVKIYHDIFTSKKITHVHRVYHASFAIHFMRFWKENTCTKEKSSIISDEALEDLRISSYCVINLTRILRDYFPQCEFCFHKLGTECVEEFFSMMGSTQENKHTYTIYDMIKNSRKYFLKKLMLSEKGSLKKLNIPIINSKKQTDNNEDYNLDEFFDSSLFPEKFPTDRSIASLWRMAKAKVRDIFQDLSVNKFIMNFNEDIMNPLLIDNQIEENSQDDLEIFDSSDLQNEDLNTESLEEQSHLYFVIDGQKFHKKSISKLFNDNKISNDRLKRIMEGSLAKSKNHEHNLEIGDIVRVKSAESFWMIIRILTIKDNEKREIYSLNLNDIEDTIKFYGILLKPFDVERSLFSFQKQYRKINAEDIIRKVIFEIEGNHIFIQLNSESRLGKK